MGGKWTEEAKQKLKNRRGKPQGIPSPKSEETTSEEEGPKHSKKRNRIPECWHLCLACNEKVGHFLDPENVFGNPVCTNPETIPDCKWCSRMK